MTTSDSPQKASQPMGNKARLDYYLKGSTPAASTTATWKRKEGRPVQTVTYQVTPKQRRRLLQSATPTERKLNASNEQR